MLKMTTFCKKHKHGGILRGMSILVKATPAPTARTKETKQMAYLYAGLLVVLAVTQLFTFDEFIELVPAFNLPFGTGFTYALAPLIVATEVFAIPFLLRMQLSVAFRWLSMFFGWFVAAMWAFISIWIVTTNPDIETVGYFGTLVTLVPGWWAVCIAFALGILAAWTGWGLWPGRRTKK